MFCNCFTHCQWVESARKRRIIELEAEEDELFVSIHNQLKRRRKNSHFICTMLSGGQSQIQLFRCNMFLFSCCCFLFLYFKNVFHVGEKGQ